MSGLYHFLYHSVLSEEHHMAMSSFWVVIKPSPPHLPCIQVQTAHFKSIMDVANLLDHMPHISNCADF